MKPATFHRRASGFSVLELSVTIAIAGLIMVGLATLVFQLISHREHTQAGIIAGEQLNNAHYWFSLDGLVSQNMVIGDDPQTPSNEVLTLLWVGFERTDEQENQLADLYEIRYAYENQKISRTKTVTTGKYDSDGNLLDLHSDNSTMTVASNITQLNISADNLTFNVSLDVAVDDFENTKSFSVSPRAATGL